MNELTTLLEDKEKFPMVYEGLKKLDDMFSSIKSWKDIERMFFMGNGLSKNTYKTYMYATKEFFEFVGQLNPLQIKPSHIEEWYNSMTERLDKKSCALKIAGLKKFFKNVKEKCPLCTSPFDVMDKKLLKKIMKIPKSNGRPEALSKDELDKLFEFLRKDDSTKGVRNYALIQMLAATAMRISALMDVCMSDIYEHDGKRYIDVLGKGNKRRQVFLRAEAFEAVMRYHVQVYGELPSEDEYLFYSLRGDKWASNSAWTAIDKVSKEVNAINLFGRQQKLYPHLFRKSCLTGLYREKMPIVEIMRFSGHSDYKTLIDNYLAEGESPELYLDKLFKKT